MRELSKEHNRADLILNSVITCPHCGFEKLEAMPENACVHFYDCANCGMSIRPKEGECYVFCSYGTVHCPPKQRENSGSRQGGAA